jgi:hypothetical protein
MAGIMIRPTILLLALLAVCASTAAAQLEPGPGAEFLERPFVAVGYAANAPEQLAGVGLVVTHPALRRWGVYVNYQWSPESPKNKPNYDPTITSVDVDNEIGDQFVSFDIVWKSINVAVARSIMPQLTVYAGAGYARSEGFDQFFDEEQERGDQGYYWVTNPDDEGTEVNLLLGAFLRAGRYFAFQIGLESAPKGFTVGGSFVLPF